MKQSQEGVKVLLLDIEGTICPISFVKDTLFPYALNALPSILQSQWTSPEFAPYKSAFPESAQSSPEAFLSHVRDLTARDVKIAYLKNLQGVSPYFEFQSKAQTDVLTNTTESGYLWQTGYHTSAYSTPLFPDVVPSLTHYSSTATNSNKTISIYSSGSIFAQKLLFQHVQSPLSASSATSNPTVDLTNLMNPAGWFDTTNAGPKTNPQSYTTIANQLGHPVSTILFLSDNTQEVAAALQAGLRAVVVDRPGNAPLTDSDRERFDIISSLEELDIK